jgi:hypothetical protein
MFKEYFTIFYQIAVMILLILICIKIYNSQEKYNSKYNLIQDCLGIKNQTLCEKTDGCTWNELSLSCL